MFDARCGLLVQWLVAALRTHDGAQVRHFPADAHSDAGIRERDLRVRRQRSNRRWTLANPAACASVFLAILGCPPQTSAPTAEDTTPFKTIHTRLPEGHHDRERGDVVDVLPLDGHSDRTQATTGQHVHHAAALRAACLPWGPIAQVLAAKHLSPGRLAAASRPRKATFTARRPAGIICLLKVCEIGLPRLGNRVQA